MTSICHLCGSPLRAAYQRIGTRPAEYLVFCSKLSDCQSFSNGAEGRGDTEQQAVQNYNLKHNPNATIRH